MSNLSFDAEKGIFIKREEIRIGNTTEAAEIKEALKIELAGIVRQVKGLKRRAEEIKTMLNALEEKAGPIDPAPPSRDGYSVGEERGDIER